MMTVKQVTASFLLVVALCALLFATAPSSAQMGGGPFGPPPSTVTPSSLEPFFVKRGGDVAVGGNYSWTGNHSFDGTLQTTGAVTIYNNLTNVGNLRSFVGRTDYRGNPELYAIGEFMSDYYQFYKSDGTLQNGAEVYVECVENIPGVGAKYTIRTKSGPGSMATAFVINDSQNVSISATDTAGTSYKHAVNGAQRVVGRQDVGGAQSVAGAATFDSTLGVTGAVSLNGGLTMDTDKFTVADGTGNTTIAGTLGVAGVASFSAGNAAAPSISFTADIDTGMYSGGTNILGLSTAGTARAFINSYGNMTVGGSDIATTGGNDIGLVVEANDRYGIQIRSNANSGDATPSIGNYVPYTVRNTNAAVKTVYMLSHEDQSGSGTWNIAATNINDATSTADLSINMRGTGGTSCVYLNNTGNLTLGAADLASTTSKLYVDSSSGTPAHGIGVGMSSGDKDAIFQQCLSGIGGAFNVLRIYGAKNNGTAATSAIINYSQTGSNATGAFGNLSFKTQNQASGSTVTAFIINDSQNVSLASTDLALGAGGTGIKSSRLHADGLITSGGAVGGNPSTASTSRFSGFGSKVYAYANGAALPVPASGYINEVWYTKSDGKLAKVAVLSSGTTLEVYLQP